ncbi:nicotinate phosphoribosyltransferase [Brachybacterium sp. NBEC-018]|uniref:nicotinate phosphoribosyltransferase n=1 Tax=Brachybacterium sp. NBEC-018 TaxID=2996004 RepID=UPI002174D3E5|nr:nicotinate phosphoribosyltransferase [Brachybacterium sp. NBEC-018]UVY82496.1 nicotinate phosphoribosyltransferase [Brachybacterium sp. NBEC-018]
MTSSLLTDLYELTMLRAAREAGTAERACVFEVFTRSLPEGRRYGVLAGTDRVLRAIADFRFDEADLRYLRRTGVLDEDTLAFLADYRFTGDVHGYAEGELFFEGSPVLRIEGTFADAVMLETVVLSILNHDSGVASAGSRMITAARGRPCIEMGGRRVHEDAAIAAARAAYLVGFASTSNLAAGAHYRIPVAGTSAHAFTLLFDTEEEAFRAQIASQGAGTTVLVDTYDVEQAVRTAVGIAGPGLGAVRLDSGDLGAQAREVRALLDSLGATSTRITATSDLDEHRLDELADAPIDGYGIGTRLVTGGGHPAPGFVFKLVEREGADGAMHPVGKRSADKQTLGAGKSAYRLLVGDRARAELVLPGEAEVAEFERELTAQLLASQAPAEWARTRLRPLQVPLLQGGHRVWDLSPVEALEHGRERHASSLAELCLRPEDGPDGPIAIPTLTDGAQAARALG